MLFRKGLTAQGAFATGFVVLAVAHSPMTVVVAGLLCGVGHGYTFPILYAISFGRAASRDRGSASAIYTGIFDAGAFLGGPILGGLIHLVGYSGMFLVAALWVATGAVAFAVWDVEDRRHSGTTPVSLG